MKISRLEIENIKGIEHIYLQPGTVTVISGANGSGKSSIIDAVMAVFEGGSDPSWLRNGANKGRVVIEITDDDGKPVATIKKTISLKLDGEGVSTTLEILDPNGVPIPAPQTFIRKLGSSWAVNPSVILSIDTSTAGGRKALMAHLLEIMPIEFRATDLIAAGVPDAALPKRSTLTLDDLAKVREYVRELRRKVGIEAKESEASAQALRKSLPKDGEDTDWTARAAQIRAERNSLAQTEEAEKAGIGRDAAVAREAADGDFRQKEAELRAVFERRLAELKQEKADKLAKISEAEQSALAEINEKYKPAYERLTAELAAAQEKAEQQQRAAGIRESEAIFSKRAREKNLEYDALTRTLERMDALKKAQLDNLPIEGLGFEGDTVTVDGVPWHHVNTARRAMVAAQLAAMLRGELPFMVLDDCEHLDSDTRREFEEAIAASGFQVIEAVVSDGPLAVEVR